MPDSINRFVLPIHDRPHVGLTTYDAKDPDTSSRLSTRCGLRKDRPTS